MRREFKKKSKVLLIDDNYEHLVGIRELLNLEGTFDVVGIATNVNVGLNLIKKYQPDIVLLDMNMPERDGLQGIVEISKLELGTKVLALSGYDDADLIFRAMKIGAKGYVLKTMASAQLIYAIEEVLNGKIYLPLPDDGTLIVEELEAPEGYVIGEITSHEVVVQKGENKRIDISNDKKASIIV